ncbi:conserved hypothetical protein [Clostridium neonatale]|uniref:hypothetical protein n=1 Tax=Clostridium neonatale TaxID=137838 RepID=UPI00291B4CED|nr:hypothetical protein [Clostridium neonatale]CAI3224398.1 conserved hypothetical protein [Clostridium neonatale]
MLSMILSIVLIIIYIFYITEYRKLIRKEKKVEELLECLIKCEEEHSNNYKKLIEKTNEVIKANRLIVSIYNKNIEKVKSLELILNKTKKFRVKKKLEKRIARNGV